MDLYYTYLHCKPGCIPFYVGKGKGSRAYNLTRTNKHHSAIINKYGRENIKIYVFNCNSEEEAYADEILQIKHLINEGFNLANKSSGGEYGSTGFHHSEETKEKLRKINIGRKVTDRQRLKMIGNKNGVGWVPTEAQRKKISAANIGNKKMLGKFHTEETKMKISISKLNKTFTNEHKLKISLSIKEHWIKRRSNDE